MKTFFNLCVIVIAGVIASASASALPEIKPQDAEQVAGAQTIEADQEYLGGVSAQDFSSTRTSDEMTRRYYETDVMLTLTALAFVCSVAAVAGLKRARRQTC